MAKKRKRRVSPQVAITSDKAHKKVIKDRLKELMEIVQKKQEKELTKILLHLGKLLKKEKSFGIVFFLWMKLGV